MYIIKCVCDKRRKNKKQKVYFHNNRPNESRYYSRRQRNDISRTRSNGYVNQTVLVDNKKVYANLEESSDRVAKYLQKNISICLVAQYHMNGGKIAKLSVKENSELIAIVHPTSQYSLVQRYVRRQDLEASTLGIPAKT